MASILTPAAFSAATKILYPKGLSHTLYPASPFLEAVKKSSTFYGASKQINPLYAGLRGSTDFASALQQKATPSIASFQVTRVRDYVIGSIGNETLAASRNETGAVATALKTSLDSAGYEFGRSQAFQLWGDGTGTRGTVSAYAAGVITLSQSREVVNFEVGMVLEKKNSGGTLLTGTMTITAISRDAGTLTVTLGGGAADPAANDTLARLGDYTATGSNCLAGVLSWVPVTEPTSGDSHFGVDRSVDPLRLSGIRYDGNGANIEDSVFQAQAEAAINGASDVDTLWMNTARFAELCKSLQGKAWYQQAQAGKAQVGFSGFTFPGERGPVMVKSDPNCPYAYGLLTCMKEWEMCTLDAYPHFAENGGGKFLTESSADAVEYRLKMYGNLINHKPHKNVLITWD